jgi:hypothetical protein
MTVCNIRPATTSAKYSRARLAAMAAGLLLATVGAGGRAFAAAGCDAKPADHIASTQCVGHRHLRAAVHTASKTQKTVSTTAAVVGAEGDELTPVSAAASSSKAVAAQPHAAPTAALATLDVQLPHSTLSTSNEVAPLKQAGPSPWRGHGAPAGNRRPPSFDMPASAAAMAPQDSSFSLADVVHGAGGMPNVPAPAAWAILLMGLLGLTAIARQPRVARAQSWMMASPSSSAARSSAGVGAVDRVDPARYAQGPARRSHQGHFVRSSAAASGFGVGA